MFVLSLRLKTTTEAKKSCSYQVEAHDDDDDDDKKPPTPDMCINISHGKLFCYMYLLPLSHQILTKRSVTMKKRRKKEADDD